MPSTNQAAPIILVVDDVADNLRLLAKILEGQDYQVLKSLSGKMALQALQRQSPDLILLDITMPEMNGFEVCQQLKADAATAEIPIIFISALDQPSEKVRAFEVGGQDYITKPFQETEVLARVKTHLLIRDQQRQIQQEITVRHAAEAEAQRLNAHLERQIQSRTLELQQALSCEWALKHISDQVRDSLDQHRILQTTVETLAWALEGHCCDAALYSADHLTSTIRYQWTQPGLTATQGQTLQVKDFPDLYEQLRQGICFAFCQITPSPIRNHSAILACPIFDETVNQAGIVGDLWLFRDRHSSFGETEVRLVQQVANQCAIALRQARLYEAAQSQVAALERLNQLKDDFLSTISHELRTPLASMKMMMNLLQTFLTSESTESPGEAAALRREPRILTYLELLQQECDRELKLVEDLLSLQHVEAGTYTLQPLPIQLQDLLRHLLEPFESITRSQQQTLVVEIADDLPSLQLDPFVLNRIITELLNNAYKYTPAGETITVTAQVLPPRAAIAPLDCVEITITNTGVAIPAAELPRIFDKFYRIPNHDPWKHSGTGLGLALIKKWVEQMAGELTVTSTQSATQFMLRLASPRAASTTTSGNQSPA